jgi:hypothetical protein
MHPHAGRIRAPFFAARPMKSIALLRLSSGSDEQAIWTSPIGMFPESLVFFECFIVLEVKRLQSINKNCMKGKVVAYEEQS